MFQILSYIYLSIYSIVGTKECTYFEELWVMLFRFYGRLRYHTEQAYSNWFCIKLNEINFALNKYLFI